MKNAYQNFLASKQIKAVPTGLKTVPALNPALFDFQADVVRWSLKLGRAALFEDCGMGKTIQELEWCKHVPGRKLILAPLAVSIQTAKEAEKFGYDVTICESDADVRDGTNIINYEKLHKIDAGKFDGVVLDESSILKSYDGKTRQAIVSAFNKTPFRLAGTATPAPNDYMELGNHAEFLGVMTRTEMLATFFVHDGGDTSKWRIKGHAQSEFWKWVCSWAVNLRKPSDLGYPDGDFTLPELKIREIAVDSNQPSDGYLFALPASSLQERRQARRASLDERIAAAMEIANGDDQFLIWCDLNCESEKLAAIPGAVEIKGADSDAHKLSAAAGFVNGTNRCLVSKPSIFGWGMNWQHCHNVIFVGLSDSWEEYYQAVRRVWRFGQRKPVNVWIITSKNEGAVVANIKRKEIEAQKMAQGMVAHMAEISKKEIKGSTRMVEDYKPKQRIQIPEFLCK